MDTHAFKCKIGDKILIGTLVIIAIIFMAWSNFGVSRGGQLTAVITQNGNVIKQINLNDLQSPEIVNINYPIKEVILAEKDRIRFFSAKCPDPICVRTGWLTRQGDKAICMPARVVVTILGEKKQQIDTLAY